MPMPNQALLRQIIDDPHSTITERTAAQAELNLATGATVAQSLIDRELESYWNNSSRSDAVALRQHFSAASRQLLADIGTVTYLGVPAPKGAEERITSLLETTKSPQVRQRAQVALNVIQGYRNSGRYIEHAE